MDEPSVWDYVKAKLQFWRPTDLHLFSRLEEAQRSDSMGQEIEVAHPTKVSTPLKVGVLAFVLLPAFFALLAQSFLEPPDRSVTFAVALYGLSAFLALVSYARGGLLLVEHAAFQAPMVERMHAEDPGIDRHASAGDAAVDEGQMAIPDVENAASMHVRIAGGTWPAVAWIEAVMGIGLALIAFLLFTNNRFTVLNVTLWAISLGLLLFAFLSVPAGWHIRTLLARGKRILSMPSFGGHISVTRWGVLVLALIVLVGFFRFYRLDQLPIDMVSDHAEKLLDINDVLHGQTSIFFERNTGREPFQFYWTALVMKVFGLGVSFFSLKLATVLIGLFTLVYVYRLGGLVGNRAVALLSFLFVGVSYWANVISRIALRFPLYPFFVAPLLFHLIRGMRQRTRNDFIWAGVWLGIGLNSYTASRVVPLLVVFAVGLYLIHRASRGYRLQAILGLFVTAFLSLVICLPLLHYTIDQPDMVMYRTLTRMSTLETPIVGSPVLIFLNNFWRAMTMFFYNNGGIWTHSIPFRPALDVVMAAFFFLGAVLLLARLVHKRDWEDALLLISVPVLMLPSMLSIAFPDENPSLNRTAAAYVPVLIIAAMGMEALLRRFGDVLAERFSPAAGRNFALVLGLLLAIWTTSNNYQLFFVQYADNYQENAWNTREIGQAAYDFASLTGTFDTYYLVAFPYWADSRQVAIFAGHIERDPAILPEQIPDTLADPRMKMYILYADDTGSLQILRQTYPNGSVQLHHSPQPHKDFVLFFAPAQQDFLP